MRTSVGFTVNHLARLYVRALRKRIAEHGIVPGQVPALMVLCAQDGLTQKELLAKLDIEQATLTNTLSRMERDQLISRKPLAADARFRTIHLTKLGQSVCSCVAEASRQLDEIMFQKLSDEERRAFLSYIRRVSAATLRHESFEPSNPHDKLAEPD